MTTMPMPPVPPTGAANQGTTAGNLGGAAGTLLGANMLQQSIDRLNVTVGNLITAVTNMKLGGGGLGAGGMQQQANQARQTFPQMLNPFQASPIQAGIGGGGPGGAGNISAPSTFSGRFAGPLMMASAAASFGQQQMPNLLTLNQYATSSMIGMNMNGMSRGQAMQMLYRQAGFGTNNLNALGLSPQDLLSAMPSLQQRAGSMMVNSTPIGRATLGAQAAFGMMNPTLGAQASAQMAAALYSPQFSLNMMRMGYRPILSQIPGAAPMNAGMAAQSILRTMGLGRMNAAQVFGNLSSGVGQANLQYLFGPAGINNQQASQFLTGYAQLFSKGLNAQQATTLFQQASSGNLTQMQAAQRRLTQLGVPTTTNDVQALKNAQSVVTGREGLYAAGFDRGLQDATGLLNKFNTALSDILKSTGAGTGIGYAGGFSGVMAGTSHGVGILGTLGGLLTIGKLLGLGGGSGGGLGGVLSKIPGVGGAARGLGAAGPYGAAVAGGLAAGIGGVALGSRYGRTVLGSMGIHNLFGLGANNAAAERAAIMNAPNLSASTKAHLLHLISLEDQGQTLTQQQQSQLARAAGMGGGAGPLGGTAQAKTGGNNMSSISGAAKKAVSAAESQLGVAYEWGAEIPGVGFDCSALIQWAYKQAGVNLPRTSQAQWSALAKRSIALNAVQEGDLVFSAGSDGSANSPGHVGMMVNNRQLIQAPYTGANVQIIGYDPKAWSHAARPAGSGSFTSGTSGGPGAAASSAVSGNTGASRAMGGTYGSVNEVDIISAMGSSMGGGRRISNGSSGRSNTVTGGGSTPAHIPSNARQIAAIAQRIARDYGWGTGLQWTDFVNIVNAESGWQVSATNPTSGAYGIPQALPGSKMASAGSDWQTNPATQLKWMFGYIKQRWGTPANAWAHEQSMHWYGAGGKTMPGWAIVGDRGPELMFQGGGNQVFSNSQTMQLINAIKGASPAQSPWKTDVTSGSSKGSYAGRPVNVNFNQGSIVIQSSGTGTRDATNTAREVSRQIIKHISDEAINEAIRTGEKL